MSHNPSKAASCVPSPDLGGGIPGVSLAPVIVWINGTHGAGKTTISLLVQQLIPDSRVLDAEKVGETLMDIKPGLPWTGNFQDWHRGGRSWSRPPGACSITPAAP